MLKWSGRKPDHLLPLSSVKVWRYNLPPHSDLLHGLTYNYADGQLLFFLSLSVAQQPKSNPGRLIFEVCRSHTHIRSDSSERVISPSQKLLPVQETQEMNIYDLGGIRTRGPNDRVTAELILRRRGYRDRFNFILPRQILGGGAVGWGTVLQAERWRVQFPMASLKFCIDIILLAALWP
jgi:hypothetical protein